MEIKEIAEQVANELGANFKEDRQFLKDLVKQATLSRIVNEVENYATSVLSDQYRGEFSEIVSTTISEWIRSGKLKCSPSKAAKDAYRKSVKDDGLLDWDGLFSERDRKIFIAYKSGESTKSELSTQFGISIARVGQIIFRMERDAQSAASFLESMGYTISS